MKEPKNYVQSSVLRCAATIRPSYCQYNGNVCCFSCDKNAECTAIAVKEKLMRPCRPTMGIKMQDESMEYVGLFDEETRCEFSI